MISLKDLNNYDIQNIDVNKLLKSSLNRKDILLNAAIIFVAAICILKILDSRNATYQSITNDIATLDKKISAIADFEKAKTKLNLSLNGLPEGLNAMNMIIETTNAMAIDNEVQISSVDPLGQESTDFYTKTTLRLKANSEHYEALGNFLKEIEDSNDNMRLESCQITAGTGDIRRREMQDDLPKVINAEFIIASIQFKK